MSQQSKSQKYKTKCVFALRLKTPSASNTLTVLSKLLGWFWFSCLVVFYGISTILGYLMPNPLYTYILNIYDLVWLGFMAYQPF